ncbi:hypothetical protein E1I69_12875 [Bacillus timonensis]|uniref:DUF4878 domain-containing protein n=1 Tax=Bacillus timonensis TaxID=1033734 RepID=A0A4V3V7L5_9BACI|nr:hypothetical protein [Bacillus timonensis]THE11903.1 hypothetical protein E1I69_12875 [Bacillus timonensis]
MRRRRGLPIQLILIIVGAILFVILVISFFRSSPEEEAKELVHSFYKYEQDADFGSSWELFHPLMQERFQKADYIQQRNHVFVGHFGTDTFKFTIEDAEKLKSWQMTQNSTTFHDVYKVPITQTYKSTYGTFSIHQDVFVVHEDGDWMLLWSYR